MHKSQLPDEFLRLKESGEMNIYIPWPRNPRYRNVRVSGHVVQAFAFPGTPAASVVTSTQLKKGLYSIFYSKNRADPFVFSHPDVAEHRLYPFAYTTATCDALVAPCTDISCDAQAFMSVSPYGHWIFNIDKQEYTQQSLDAIDEVRSVWEGSNCLLILLLLGGGGATADTRFSPCPP